MSSTSSEAIKAAVAGAVEYLSAHPAEARYTDEAVTAVWESGLKFSTRVGDETMVTDMPASVGGGGSAPSPGAFFRAAIASCLGTLVALRAASESVEITALEVTIDSESDDRGILGADPSVVAGPLSVRAVVRLETDAPDERVGPILDWALAHCPVTEALGRVVPLNLDWKRGVAG